MIRARDIMTADVMSIAPAPHKSGLDITTACVLMALTRPDADPMRLPPWPPLLTPALTVATVGRLFCWQASAAVWVIMIDIIYQQIFITSDKYETCDKVRREISCAALAAICRR